MSLDQFKSIFGDGIRPNLYEVAGGFGVGGGSMAPGEQFLIKAAAVPSASLGIIKFIKWSNSFIALDNDRRGPLSYADWTITPQDNAGNNVRAFTLKDCWPMEVGTIDLGFDTTDAVAEFTVTIGFERWSYDGLPA